MHWAAKDVQTAKMCISRRSGLRPSLQEQQVDDWQLGTPIQCQEIKRVQGNKTFPLGRLRFINSTLHVSQMICQL